MACPYFCPKARLKEEDAAHAPRLPLGDAYAGECRAQQTAYAPDETRTRGLCNVGYARAGCDRFPQDALSDAVRFHMVEDQGERIRIQYIFERDCWPREHGVLEYSLGAHAVEASGDREILRIQAGAFAESYLRRRDDGYVKAVAR